jgi:cytochrome c oxidase subunit 3
MVSVGTIIWLSSELMFFAALFAAYFTIRAVSPELWAQETEKLNVPFSTVNTAILVASSFACQWGVFAAERGDVFKLRRWFSLTFLMGLAFVVGQGNEFRMEILNGNTISRTVYGSVFFIAEGFHGLHVVGGLAAFIYFLIRTSLGRFTPAQATAAIVVSYYWHFVDVVWIGLFSVIYIIQ